MRRREKIKMNVGNKNNTQRHRVPPREYFLSGTCRTCVWGRPPREQCLQIAPDTLYYRVMWLSTVVWKKGSMCEWRCYERVLKNWDNFTQNMKARDSPFTTNSSLTFSHPNLKRSNKLSSCCWKCSSEWQNVLNPHCYLVVTDIKLITLWCVVYCIFGSTHRSGGVCR